MLGDAKVDEHGNVDDLKDCNIMYLDKDGEDREINVNCLFCDHDVSVAALDACFVL